MSRSKSRQQIAAAGNAFIETELARLSALNLNALRGEWKHHFATPPPRISSRGILCRLIAWQLQANALGGLDRKTERTLESMAERLERDPAYEPKLHRALSPGVELAREWKGTIHKVTVLANGFQYLGKQYRSLSDIARMITGTHWSGPRFFGLERKSEPRTKTKRTGSTATDTAEPA